MTQRDSCSSYLYKDRTSTVSLYNFECASPCESEIQKTFDNLSLTSLMEPGFLVLSMLEESTKPSLVSSMAVPAPSDVGDSKQSAYGPRSHGSQMYVVV